MRFTRKLVFDGLKFVSFANARSANCSKRTLTFKLSQQELRDDRLAGGIRGRSQAGDRRDEQAAEPDDQPHQPAFAQIPAAIA